MTRIRIALRPCLFASWAEPRIAQWTWLRAWTRQLWAFLDDQNSAARPNRHAWGIFRPVEIAATELAKLSNQYLGLGAELTRFLSVSDESFRRWSEKVNDSRWLGVLERLYELKTRLKHAIEALDGPLDSPPVRLLENLSSRQGLCYAT